MGITMNILILNLSLTFTQVPNWHEDGFFEIHFDLQPNAKDTELGRETTPKHISEFLLKIKPDFVQYG